MAQDEELQVIEERDIYDKTVADIPADAKLLEAVRNRPRAYVFFGILALAIFIALAAPSPDGSGAVMWYASQVVP